jgi:hypothetical protein
LVAEAFAELDLSDADSSQVTVDAAAVSRLSPLTRTLNVVAGSEDQLVVLEPSDWRMTAPIVTATGRFLRTATNVSGSDEVILYDHPNSWQNFVRFGDVNNDGALSASDALRIINELKRRDFSDPDTQVLQAPSSLTPWPGVYFDHSADGSVTALDALRVINDLARQSLAGGGGAEGEATSDAIRSVPGSRVLPMNGASDATAVMSLPDHRPRDPVSALPLSSQIASVTVDANAGESETVPVAVANADAMAEVDQLLSDSSFLDDLLR